MTLTQQKVMLYLGSCTDATTKEITDATGVKFSDFRACLADLYADELVSKTRDDNCKRNRYALSDGGARMANRMVRYHQCVTGNTKSDRIKPMELPCYVPPARGYLRNSGHIGIASRGLM